MRKQQALLAVIVLLAAAAIVAMLGGCSTPTEDDDPGIIVFESRYADIADIYMIKPDGTELTELVAGPTWDGTPSLSPDRSQLAFASDRDGDPEIYIMDMETMSVTQLTSNTAADLMPVWSPDGNWIAFVSDRVYKVPLEGGSLEIAAGMELYIMRADGSELTRLSKGESDYSLYPSWAPDSTRVVYMNVGGSSANLYVANANDPDAEPINLTAEVDAAAWNPDWSPDGQYIAFMADHPLGKDVFRIDADGQNLVNLTVDWAGLSGDPSWSPDSQRIVFATNPDDGEHVNLYVMTKDGTDITPLTTEGEQYVQPEWSK
jgi:TolB protein